MTYETFEKFIPSWLLQVAFALLVCTFIIAFVFYAFKHLKTSEAATILSLDEMNELFYHLTRSTEVPPELAPAKAAHIEAFKANWARYEGELNEQRNRRRSEHQRLEDQFHRDQEALKLEADQSLAYFDEGIAHWYIQTEMNRKKQQALWENFDQQWDGHANNYVQLLKFAKARLAEAQAKADKALREAVYEYIASHPTETATLRDKYNALAKPKAA